MEKTKRYMRKCLLFVLLCLLMAFSFAGCGQSQEKAFASAMECLINLDVGGAEAYAEKLREDSIMHDNIARMKQFLVAYDAGNWSEAIAIYNTDSSLPNSGLASATYLNCYYHTLVEPAALLLEQGETASAVGSLLQFHNRFYWNPHYSTEEHVYIGNYKVYTEFFPQNVEHYQQLVEQAGKAVLSDKKTDTLALMAGFQEGYTVDFQEYSWSGDYINAVRDYENTLAATPLTSCRALVEGGKADEAYQIMVGYLRPRTLGSTYYAYFPYWAVSTVEGTDLMNLRPLYDKKRKRVQQIVRP